MGIKGFSTWLRARFPLAFASVKVPCTFDEVYIDLNSYLYKSASRSKTSQQVLKELENRLLSTLRSIRARKRVFVSIDGVAPAAKLDVQRARRAGKALESARTKVFDAQNFTPGCLFMGQVEESLKKIGELYAAKHGPDFEFIVSGASVKEEGEIKIARELALQHRLTGGERLVARAVLTADSDALLQAFVHEIPSLFILNASDMKAGVSCFSGQVMRDEVQRLLPTAQSTRQVQLDFGLLSIFSGNDCLPGLPFGNVTYLWPGYLEYAAETRGRHAGLVDPQTLLINPEGLAAFARYIKRIKLDAGMQKLLERHLAGRGAASSTESIVDYLKSAQWSFSRLLGYPVAQTLSLFLAPHAPAFFELADLDVARATTMLADAFAQAKDNKLDKRKIPGAAAIMMLDPTSERSHTYVAKPLRELFKAFHAEECALDDHARFKKLCQTIGDMAREAFTEEEIRVTYPRLPVVYTKRRHVWKVYDPSSLGKTMQEADAKPQPLPCPVFTSLYGKKLAASR